MLQILLKNIRKIIAEDINTVNRIVYTNQSQTGNLYLLCY